MDAPQQTALKHDHPHLYVDEHGVARYTDHHGDSCECGIFWHPVYQKLYEEFSGEDIENTTKLQRKLWFLDQCGMHGLLTEYGRRRLGEIWVNNFVESVTNEFTKNFLASLEKYSGEVLLKRVLYALYQDVQKILYHWGALEEPLVVEGVFDEFERKRKPSTKATFGWTVVSGNKQISLEPNVTQNVSYAQKATTPSKLVSPKLASSKLAAPTLKEPTLKEPTLKKEEGKEKDGKPANIFCKRKPRGVEQKKENVVPFSLEENTPNSWEDMVEAEAEKESEEEGEAEGNKEEGSKDEEKKEWQCIEIGNDEINNVDRLRIKLLLQLLKMPNYLGASENDVLSLIEADTNIIVKYFEGKGLGKLVAETLALKDLGRIGQLLQAFEKL